MLNDVAGSLQGQARTYRGMVQGRQEDRECQAPHHQGPQSVRGDV